MALDSNKSNEFYGNTTKWFTGRVIRRSRDPLYAGRVYLEIPGVTPIVNPKSPPKSDKQAENMGLMLSTVLGFSDNGVKPPREGSVVYGQFMNPFGDVPKEPLIIGVIPGIQSEQGNNIYINSGIKTPKSSQDFSEVGKPTTPPLSRGVVKDTLTSRLNGLLEHACDGGTQLWGAVEYAKQLNAFIMKGVNAVVKYFTEMKGNDSTGIMSKIIDRIKDITTFLNWIVKKIKAINEFIAAAVEVAKMIRAVIDYILSFPARILEFIKDCLSKMLVGVNSFLKEVFSTKNFAGFGEGGDFTELMNEFSNLQSAASGVLTEVANTSSTVGNVASALTTPSSQSDIDDVDVLATKAVDTAIDATVGTAGRMYNHYTADIGAKQAAP